jgi:hypothetical protein
MVSPRIMAMLAATSLTAAPTAAADAPPPPAFYAALREADARVATIGYRLAVGNAALCRQRQPQAGLALAARDQFSGPARAGAEAAWHFEAPVLVEAVVAQAASAKAGVRAGDSLIGVNGTPLPHDRDAPDTGGTAQTRNAADMLIADQPVAAPLRLALRRDGVDRTVTVAAQAGCRAAFEMILGDRWIADSDGERIRIGSRFLEGYDDNAVAVVVAHELAHLVLMHRVRLEAAGVSDGLLKEVGRSGRLRRQIEDEADALSVSLLYNAGFDPRSAARFWRDGAPHADGLFRALYYRSNGERAALLDKAAAAIPARAPRPVRPALLATRDQPLG